MYSLAEEDQGGTTDTLPATRHAVELINAQLSSLAHLNKTLDQGYVGFDSVDIMNQESWAECFVQS